MYTMTYYSTMRKKEALPLVTAWMDPEGAMLSEKCKKSVEEPSRPTQTTLQPQGALQPKHCPAGGAESKGQGQSRQPVLLPIPSLALSCVWLVAVASP